MVNECKVTMGSPVLFYSQILIQLSYHKLLCISTERAIAPHVNSTLCVAICKKFEATSWGSSCPNHLPQLVILTNDLLTSTRHSLNLPGSWSEGGCSCGMKNPQKPLTGC